jgi:hypothetical protein
LDICKDKNGIVIGDKSEIMNRWVEYFEETLNRTDEQAAEKYNISLLKLRLNLLHYLRLKWQ